MKRTHAEFQNLILQNFPELTLVVARDNKYYYRFNIGEGKTIAKIDRGILSFCTPIIQKKRGLVWKTSWGNEYFLPNIPEEQDCRRVICEVEEDAVCRAFAYVLKNCQEVERQWRKKLLDDIM